MNNQMQSIQMMRQVMKNSMLFISLLLILATAALSGCAPTPTLPPPTLTPSPIPPTSTFTPQPTASATPTFTSTPAAAVWILYDKNEWMLLNYPSDWNIVNPRSKACSPSDSSDCIIRLTHLPTEDVEIEILRVPALAAFNNVDEADEYDWNAISLSTILFHAADYLKLVSRTKITVDGSVAIRRLFEYPIMDETTWKIKATQYHYQVMIYNGDFYIVRMKTTNFEEFDKYLETVDELVKTIVFQK